jgi:hypothetical protein
MSALIFNVPGGYDFLEGIEPYSSGVVAREGFEVVHVTLDKLLPWRDGFARVEEYLKDAGLGREALCGVELRSPKAFSMEGFAEFNKGYRQLLEDWGLMVDGQNPVARTNVAPFDHAPDEVSLFAFSHTVPNADMGRPTFVVAGGGEVRGSLCEENIVRLGETDADAMAEKAAWVMDIMENRLTGLGVGWDQVTATDVYTVHPLRDIVEGVLFPRMGAAALKGMTWHYSRPPIVDIEFEMDLRGVVRELVI